MNPSTDTDLLLSQVANGDSGARAELLDRHREPLKRMVGVRMDPRLAARLDPSDVVQEALMLANRQLPLYLQHRPTAFYPWIRRLTLDRLIELHRHHFDRLKRSVKREAPRQLPLPDQSSIALAERFIDSRPGPVSKLIRAELRERVLSALESLPEIYREVLILRHLEQLTTNETAEVLDVRPGTVRTRYCRAIQYLTDQLNPSEDSSGPT